MEDWIPTPVRNRVRADESGRNGPPMNRGLSLGPTTPSRKTAIVTELQAQEAGRISRRRNGKNKGNMRIGTWNTRTLYRPRALKVLLETLDKYKMNITALQEIRWKGSGIMEKQEHTIFYSCHERNHVEGVGFVVNNNVKHLIIGFETISPRICKIRLKSRFF